MSFTIPLNSLNDELKKQIVLDLHFQKHAPSFKPKSYLYNSNIDEIVPYRINDQFVYIPFDYALNKLKRTAPPRNTFALIVEDKHIYSKLRDPQRQIFDDIILHLGKYHTALLALHVGFGKSILAMAISNKIKLRTIIVTHRVLLCNQWKESMVRWCPNHVTCIFDPKKKILQDCDFLICTVLNVPKIPLEYAKTIGFVVVDECHLISTAHFSKSLNYLFPRYMIGLSATPYRKDGMDKLMDMYFGEKRFTRVLKLEHVVYKIQTSFEPKIQLNRNGEMDWNHILEQQCNHEERNRMIISLCALFPDRRILILCKRVKQAEVLHEMAIENNLSATSLIGNKNTFSKDAHILIATVQKAGVGFSHDVLDMLILASDVEEYYIQYLGRVTRRPDVTPIIIDIVDKNKILQNHFRTRKKVYEEIGGSIQLFQGAYPSFHII